MIRIRDEQPGSYFRELKKQIFGFKYIHNFFAGDAGSGMEKIWIRDKHTYRIKNTLFVKNFYTFYLGFDLIRNDPIRDPQQPSGYKLSTVRYLPIYAGFRTQIKYCTKVSGHNLPCRHSRQPEACSACLWSPTRQSHTNSCHLTQELNNLTSNKQEPAGEQHDCYGTISGTQGPLRTVGRYR